MDKAARVKRTYQSSLREGQARTTRTAIIEAAWRLFAEAGYVATSVEEIAAAAGVSRATVFSAVGGKPTLLKAAFDVAIVGDAEPVSLPDRASSRAIRAEPDPGVYLDRYASLVAEMGGRVAPIAEAVRGAAGADADARELWESHLAQRRQGAANVVSDLLSKGATLRRELDPESAADVVWVLNDPGLYHQLVLRREWSSERFQAWLGGALRTQLLDLRPGQPPARVRPG